MFAEVIEEEKEPVGIARETPAARKLGEQCQRDSIARPVDGFGERAQELHGAPPPVRCDISGVHRGRSILQDHDVGRSARDDGEAARSGERDGAEGDGEDDGKPEAQLAGDRVALTDREHTLPAVPSSSRAPPGDLRRPEREQERGGDQKPQVHGIAKAQRR